MNSTIEILRTHKITAILAVAVAVAHCERGITMCRARNIEITPFLLSVHFFWLYVRHIYRAIAVPVITFDRL